MAVKKNLLANYIGQFYLLVIAIIMVPFYLKYIGAEAYGLVGFFALIQSWIMLLDMGLSPTLLREVAKLKINQTPRKLETFKYLFHSIEFIFIFIALFIIFFIVTFSSWISLNWLKVETLNIDDVSYSISLIGIMVGLRFITSLYKSGISGAEKQVWLNKMSMIIATFRYIGVLFVLHFFSSEFKHFFEYQLLIAIIELSIFAITFYKILNIGTFKLYFSRKSIAPIFSFSAGIAYSGMVWIFITQLDKLLLSGVLSLKEYGYFSLLGMIANALIQISAPISKAILPRMTALLSEDKEKEMLTIYRKATQIFAIIIFSVSGIIALYSYQLLYAWSGDINAAQWGKDILVYYTLGNVLISFAGFAFYLQYVHGNLTMHTKAYTFILFVFSPILAWSVYAYGAIGASIVWFIFALLFFFLWVPVVHHFFAPKLYRNWMLKDILPMFISTSSYLLITHLFIDIQNILDRSMIFLVLLLLGIGLFIVNSLISSIGRSFLFNLKERF